ncbi:hypothetical protein DFH06DRAFT_1295734 [Mycena polygramma]|nr:hypothetical protein DFH06DRAFT_1295734 [Mycena polygramma]
MEFHERGCRTNGASNTSATPLTYEAVLDLDRRLRRFIERAPFLHFYNKTGEARTFLANVRSHLIPRFTGNLMLYIHRGSSVQALRNRLLNPLQGPGCVPRRVGDQQVRRAELNPEYFHRWWPIWKGLVNASLIVGSIVAKSRITVMVPAALAELLAAVELVERGAMHSDVFFVTFILVPLSSIDGMSQPVLYHLRNGATAVCAAFRPLTAPLPVNLDREQVCNLRESLPTVLPNCSTHCQKVLHVVAVFLLEQAPDAVDLRKHDSQVKDRAHVKANAYRAECRSKGDARERQSEETAYPDASMYYVGAGTTKEKFDSGGVSGDVQAGRDTDGGDVKEGLGVDKDGVREGLWANKGDGREGLRADKGDVRQGL